MRPTSLNRFREQSPRPAYEANVHNVNEDSVDCGIKVLKCCNTPRCRQLGTIKSFLTVLILLGIVQGISEKFLTISAQQAALEHDFDDNLVEWLLVSNGIVQGIFAIFIAYWGNRVHKITWLCGLVVFQSFTCLLIIFPTLTHSGGSGSISTISLHVVNLLCSYQTSSSFSLEEIPHSLTTLIGLFLLQVGMSYGFTAFYTLGLTYLDDNERQHNIPALIGAALAGRVLGLVFGNLIAYFTYMLHSGWWLGWAIISPTLFVIAVVIGLFPRRMIGTMVRQAADTIVETATNSSQLSLSRTKFLSDISFFSTLGRLFQNKILLLNIAGTVFIQTALVNFALHEQDYLQSRFLIPVDDSNVLNNEWTSRILSKFMQPFVVALAILIGGLIIAKATPSPRKIVIWNLITALIVCLLFVGFIFIECSHNSIAGAYGNKLNLPYCARGCSCDQDIRFTPVCPNQSKQTYFSPCHAGCITDQLINGQRIFGNCSCGADPDLSVFNGETLFNGVSIATEGACGYENCQKMWIIFQVLVALGAVVIGSRLVGKILISIRSVLMQDTAIALALELTFVGLIVYIPGKFAYEHIADTTCQYWSSRNSLCYLHHSQNFGNYINILSAALSLIAVILEFMILFFVKDLELYGDDVDTRSVEMMPISRSATQNVPTQGEPPTAESSQPLLAQPQTSSSAVPVSAAVTVQNTNQDTRPIISAPIQTTAASSAATPSPTHSGIVTRMRQSMASRFVSSTKQNTETTRYSPVYKPPDNHIEELNFRLRSINDRVHIKFTDVDSGVSVLGAQAMRGDDINPSVGSDTDKETEINIQQLESTVSPLPSMGSSAVNSPEVTRNQDKKWVGGGYETDL